MVRNKTRDPSYHKDVTRDVAAYLTTEMHCRSWAKFFFLGGGGATWPSERNLGGMENF